MTLAVVIVGKCPPAPLPVHLCNERTFTDTGVVMLDLRLELAGPESIDDVRDLWLDLHRHERAIGPSIPFTEDEQSWRRRRALYERTLEQGHGFLVLARHDGAVVGYAFVLLEEGSDDTFQLGERFAELYSLSVSRERRRQGVGNRLLDF